MEMKMEEEDKYGECAVKEAAETLMRAEEIKKDPKLLALVKGELEKGSDTIKSIKELRQVAAQKLSEKEDDAEPESKSEDASEDGEEEEVPPELMTEEDKAAMQKINKYKERLKKFKVK